MDGDLFPLDWTPKILGVTNDPHFDFHKNVVAIEVKTKQRLSLLKALTGTTWGQRKETVIAQYKALIDSLFSYAAPIGYPNARKTSISKLHRIQNSALRVAIGCLMMSSIDHFHMEAEVMTVREHPDMYSQALTNYLQKEHPSFSVVTADSGPWDKRQTPQRLFNHKVVAYTNQDELVVDGESARKYIHTETVRDSIKARGTNRVLEAAAPPVYQEEEELRGKIHDEHWHISDLVAVTPSMNISTESDRLTPTSVCAAGGRSIPCGTSSSAKGDQRTCNRRICGCTPSGLRSSIALPFFELPEEPAPPLEQPPPNNADPT